MGFACCVAALHKSVGFVVVCVHKAWYWGTCTLRCHFMQGGASATKGKRKSAGAAPAEDEPEVVEVAEVPADDPDVMNISEPAEAASPPPAAGPQSDPKARIVSGNAYMLVYRRHGLQSSTPTEGPTQLPPK